jgi:uncharacterized linocin/CFP29 family protein
MPDDVARLPWTEEQWTALQRVVQEAAGKARVASSFLPLVGPLPPGQAAVRALALSLEPAEVPQPEEEDPRQPGEAVQRFEIDDSVMLPLTTLSCLVYLTTQQVEDPDLASAKQLLGRAADVIGRLEDAIIFNGQPRRGEGPEVKLPQVYQIQGGDRCDGLLSKAGLGKEFIKAVEVGEGDTYGADLVTKISEAILTLEGVGCFGPFACVLGHKLFEDANSSLLHSLVTPRDRIVPFLEGGPFVRSSVVPKTEGVVVSLAGSPIDLVVGSDMHVKFVQVTLEPRYVLRVSERFVLRMKQPRARCLLEGEPAPPNGKGPEAAQR